MIKYGIDGTRLRVLFVADSLYWITATIAKEICRYNPWIEPTLCSAGVLQQILDSHSGSYPGKIDLVHFLTWQIATDFMHIFRPTCPCVVTIHHIEDDRSVAPVPDADAIMTVCHQWHNELLARGTPPGKCVMVRNGVDVRLFEPASNAQKIKARKKFGIPRDSVCIGFSGKQTSNTHNRKGIETFVAAVRSLTHIESLGFAIIGPGWADLVRELEKRGVSCVYMPFLVDRRDVAAFYKAIDIYWVTSRIEGGPVPLLEAMSSGVACVSSPVGVALEAIEPNVNGFIAPFEAHDVYATITERLLRDPGERARVGLAARQTIVSQFQSSQTTQSATDLYRAAEHYFQLRGGQARSQPRFSNAKGLGTNIMGRTLVSLPHELHRQVTAAEHLQFMHYLLSAGAKNAAIRVGSRAIIANPFSVDVWWDVTRIFPRVHRFLRSCYAARKRLAAGNLQ
jgi:glycosyltransferase involved in cell wall biosynthesis